MSTLQVVVGGQYGSEAKGACTAHLAKKAASRGAVIVIRVAGPNAGHTAYDDDGGKWALRQVPVAAVADPSVELLIGAGSEIDLPVLLEEVNLLEEAGFKIRERLRIDEQATMLFDHHKKAEGALVGMIGSTGKGIGACRADRLLRKAETAADYRREFEKQGLTLAHSTWRELYLAGASVYTTVIIEGTQGYGLGLHAGHYPQCTSSNCRAIDFCAMAGIDPHWFDVYEAWVVMRTYPIRVAGNSGPLKGETTWEDLGFEPELTTVTQKVRRVGQWDPELARAAVLANGGPTVVRISLSMADYVVPHAQGMTTEDLMADPHTPWVNDLLSLVRRVEADTGAGVPLVGTGPDTFIELIR